MPARLVVEMVCYSNFWLNVFPAKDGISGDMNPHELITGQEIDYTKHCRLEFGEYTQVHEEHDNSMAMCTTGAITLRPTGNAQGGYFFYSLNTGRVLNRNRWTALPMPAEVIQRVHELACSSTDGLTFTDQHNQFFDDDDDLCDPDGDEALDDDLDASIAGVDENEMEDLQRDNETHQPDPPVNDQDEDNNFEPKENGGDNEPPPLVEQEDSEEESNDEGDEQDINPGEEQDIIPGDNGDNDNASHEQDPIKDEQWHDSNNTPEPGQNDPIVISTKADRALKKLSIDGRRPEVIQARTRSAAHAAVNVTTVRPNDYDQHIPEMESIVMTQCNMKQGIKAFGDEGVGAVRTELKQLHNKTAVKPVKASGLSRQQKKAALQYLMFLKQKKCGKIKGRGCADGRKQRATTNKEDASAPTVTVEAVMLSCTIDALKKRDVATADIPGAFLHANNDETVHVRFEGTMAKLLTKLDPKMYRKYVCKENGKTVLYVELVKALYGTLRAALLFWKKLSGILQEWGFEINPYNCASSYGMWMT